MTHKQELPITPAKQGNNPFSIEKGEHYIPSLSSLVRIYTQHPDFKPGAKLIYDLLFDYYNPAYGYAFPTIRQLERDSGLSESSVKRHIKTLEKLDLVAKGKSKHGNNTYVVKKPVNTLEQLYKKFPHIREKSEERLREIERKESEERMRRDGETKPQEEPEAEPQEIDESFF